MAIAEGSTSRLAYIAEATIGTTPATPTFKVLRHTSEGIKAAKQTEVSNEVRADANVAQIADVGRSVAGPIAFELSYGTFDDFLEALLRSTWATNVLKNGITPKTFTFEKTFEQGATDSYLRYRACRIDSMDLNLESKAIVKGSFGIVGIDNPTPTTAIISGATYTAANTNPVINASANVASLAFTGPSSSPKVKSLSLSIKSNLYANDEVGNIASNSHGLGRFEVTGSMQAYFENLDVYNALMNHDDVALSFTLGVTTLNKYTFALPKLKFMDSDGPAIPGNSQSVMMTVPFQGYYDGSSSATLTVTRAVV